MKLLKRNKSIAANRKVTKARFLYLYVIIGSIIGFVYFTLSIFTGWSKMFALAPFYLAIAYFILLAIYRNGKAIWFFIKDVERGKMLLFLNKATQWEEKHKIAVVKWTYLDKKSIREEMFKKLSKKAMDGKELSREEKKYYKKNVVMLPQQIKIGFNEALLINSLIYAHKHIQPLDKEIRESMGLTDENILSFDIMKEAKKAGLDEYSRLIEIGKKRSLELNN